MSKKHAIPLKTKFDFTNCKTTYEFIPIPDHEFDKKMNEVADILLRGYFKWILNKVKRKTLRRTDNA